MALSLVTVPPPAAPPTLTLLQGGLSAAKVPGAVPVAAPPAGLVLGKVFPLAGAFLAGYAVGTALLNLWDYFNQSQQQAPVDLSEADPPDWPQPKPGQVIRWNFERWGRQGTNFNYPVIPLEGGSATSVQGPPEITQIIPNAFSPAPGIDGPDGYYYKMSGDGGETGAVPGPVFFRLISTVVVSGDPGIDVPTISSGWAPDRSALLAPPALPEIPATAPPASPPERKDPLAPPQTLPASTPGAIPQPGPAPLPAPGPGQEPAPTPGPGQQPGALPGQIPFPVRPGAPQSVPTLPGGRPAPAPAPAPLSPPRGQANYPNGQITGTGSQPRPDLRSMARELGRIEMKLGGLLGGLGVPESAYDLWKLLELLKQPQEGGVYAIRQPCGTGPDGSPPTPIEIEFPAVTGETKAIIARLDALAQLIAVHKGLPGRVCKGKPGGDPVTVTFGEVV